MFAVIKTGGKQYVIAPESKLKIEKITPNEKGEVIFDEVLLMVDDNGKINMGTPFIEGAQIIGKLEKEGRDRKIIVFKYKAKKRYKRKAGHRQPYSEVRFGTLKTSKAKAEPVVEKKKPAPKKPASSKTSQDRPVKTK